MFPEFLPPSVTQLNESTSIATAQALRRSAISVPFHATPIESSYIHLSPHPVNAPLAPPKVSSQDRAPIVLLHGFDSSVLEFRRLLPLLAAHRSTWAVDLLSFGFCDRPANLQFTPTAIKQHLYALWQQLLGSQPIVLVGASMGGAAALDFTLTYPQAVQSLVLIDSAGFTRPPQAASRIGPPLDRWATAFLRSPRVRRRVSLRAYANPCLVTPDAELCAALHLAMPRWSEALISFTQSGGYGYFGDRMGEISQPTLVLWGRGDRILGTQAAPRFVQAIPQSRLIWIDACGHVPHLEQPKLTAQKILSLGASNHGPQTTQTNSN